MTFFFCISAIAPLIIFWLWPQTGDLNREINDAKERHIVIVKNLTMSLDKYYSNVLSTFEYILTDTKSDVNSKPRSTMLSNLDILHICVVNKKTGKIVTSVNSLDSKCPNSISIEKLQWMNAELGNVYEQVVVSDLVKEPDLNHILYAMYQNKNNIYYGVISSNFILHLGSQIRFGGEGTAVIIDRVGKIFYHPNKEFVDSQSDISSLSVVKKIKAGKTGVDFFYSPAINKQIIAGFNKSNVSGWGVMVGQPIAELTNRVSEVKNTALIVMGIGFIIAISLAYFASKVLTHPIEQIVSAMRSIGNGELWAHEKITDGNFRPKEFLDARDSIKSMAEKLQENIDTISRHAYLDGVTGLPNRECFRVLAQEEIDKLSISGSSGALLFLDLDGFKQVNDVYGHRAGDDLLLAFSQRLHEHCGIFMKRYARGLDNALTVLPARLGGDEFVVFLGNISGPETTSEFAAQLFSKVFGKFNLHNGVSLDISGSVGGAIFPTQAGDFDELLRLADIAMYEAKNSGKGRYCLHKDVEDYFENIASPSQHEIA
jgi:diguanylate cyclase (GGDEF)-like protein